VIVAAQSWKSNAEMIVTLRDLGYVSGRVLDPTYGLGNWWKLWQPDDLVAHDLKLDGVDFRELPVSDGLFDTIAFDPPYIPQGGRDTSTLNEGSESTFIDRYGLRHGPSTNTTLLELIVAGLRSFTDHLVRGGRGGEVHELRERWVVAADAPVDRDGCGGARLRPGRRARASAPAGPATCSRPPAHRAPQLLDGAGVPLAAHPVLADVDGLVSGR